MLFIIVVLWVLGFMIGINGMLLAAACTLCCGGICNGNMTIFLPGCLGFYSMPGDQKKGYLYEMLKIGKESPSVLCFVSKADTEELWFAAARCAWRLGS